MNRIRSILEEKEKRIRDIRLIREITSESKVIRIVNLAKETKNDELAVFIKERINLQGKIVEIYIRNDYKLCKVFAYVIFELSYDAKTAADQLNGVHYKSLFGLDVAQIAPEGNYKKYLDRYIRSIRDYRDEQNALMEHRLKGD